MEKNTTRRTLISGLASVALLGAATMAPALAQGFPNKPIKFVVQFPPGSATDTSARYFAKKLSEMTSQPVVIDNKAGGNSFIAVRAVLAAPADGYTVFIGSNSSLAVNAALFKSLPYDAIADFSPLTMMVDAFEPQDIHQETERQVQSQAHLELPDNQCGDGCAAHGVVQAPPYTGADLSLGSRQPVLQP